MKPNHKAAFALLGFLVLFLGLSAAAVWTFHYDLDPESKRRVAEIVAPRAQ